MFKFLNPLSDTQPQEPVTLATKRFTRFEPKQNLERIARRPAETPEVTRPAYPVRLVGQPPRPAERPTPRLQPGLDDAAHLHADTGIPISILRKALPLRFARMNASADDFVFN
jgi:hypothetical protein